MTINLEETATREENNATLIAGLDKVGLSEVESSSELDVIGTSPRIVDTGCYAAAVVSVVDRR
jgi:hypothetical protein